MNFLVTNDSPNWLKQTNKRGGALLTEVIKAQECLASGMAGSKCSSAVRVCFCVCVCELPSSIFPTLTAFSDGSSFVLIRALHLCPHSWATVMERELLFPTTCNKSHRLHLISLVWLMWPSMNQSLKPSGQNAMIGETRLIIPSLKLGY